MHIPSIFCIIFSIALDRKSFTVEHDQMHTTNDGSSQNHRGCNKPQTGKKRTKLEIWVDRSSNGKLTIIRGTTKYQQNLHPLSRHGKSPHTWGDMRLAKARKSAKMLSALDGEKVK